MSAPLVLVADDSPVVLRMIEGLLSQAGFAVATARDGIEALEKAHNGAAARDRGRLPVAKVFAAAARSRRRR